MSSEIMEEPWSKQIHGSSVSANNAPNKDVATTNKATRDPKIDALMQRILPQDSTNACLDLDWNVGQDATLLGSALRQAMATRNYKELAVGSNGIRFEEQIRGDLDFVLQTGSRLQTLTIHGREGQGDWRLLETNLTFLHNLLDSFGKNKNGLPKILSFQKCTFPPPPYRDIAARREGLRTAMASFQELDSIELIDCSHGFAQVLVEIVSVNPSLRRINLKIDPDTIFQHLGSNELSEFQALSSFLCSILTNNSPAPKLEALTLTAWCPDMGLLLSDLHRALVSNPSSPSLQSLSLHLRRPTDSRDDLIATRLQCVRNLGNIIRNLPSLRHVRLAALIRNMEEWSILCDAVKSSASIQSLNVGFRFQGDAGFPNMLRDLLIETKSLNTLGLHSMDLSNVTVADLREAFACNTTVEQLELVKHGLDEVQVASVLRGLASSRVLRELSLSAPNWQDTTLDALTECLESNTQLKKLQVVGTKSLLSLPRYLSRWNRIEDFCITVSRVRLDWLTEMVHFMKRNTTIRQINLCCDEPSSEMAKKQSQTMQIYAMRNRFKHLLHQRTDATARKLTPHLLRSVNAHTSATFLGLKEIVSLLPVNASKKRKAETEISKSGVS